MRIRRTAGSGPLGLRTLAGFGLVRVRGSSMEPSLVDGDLMVVRVDRAPSPGGLVLVHLPGDRPVAVKRALRHEPGGWWVERDNPRVGVDSWSVGVVAETDVLARVLGPVWPIRQGLISAWKLQHR